ncbi:insulinase family protein [Marivibrio halodurans]|uniref:Insulinase family protein n=1 Tax=Marivibrio halodurans TaxID=2039722 RepID=A0A8J7S241_9PROT|nr:pitrilysin family protein [Marivibrio halodurans]MBP5858932.1 insulinase family protein [Marivibrio halodurans]
MRSDRPDVRAPEQARAPARAFAALVFAALALSLTPFAARAAVFDAESFTLGNGLRVVVVENDRAPVVTQMLMYKAGSIDEMPGKSGVAHVLEHMMFKGTEEVGPGEFSAMVSRNGGQDNAFTSYDYTGYYQSVASDRLALIMRLEADRMRNLALDDAQFQPERQVVIEERNQRVENEPSAMLNEEAAPALYYNHPYSQPIIGWRHELEAMKLADLRHFYQRFYAPNNAVLVIVGDTTVEEVRDLAETYYGPIEPSEIGRTAPLMEPPHDSAHVVTLRDERVRQPSWSMRKLAPSYGTDGPTDQVYALQVLMDIVGGGNSARLYRALVVEQGVAVGAGGWYSETDRGPGTIGLYAQPAEGRSIDAVERAARAVIADVIENGVTEDEVRRAITRLQDSAATARDSLMGPARVIAQGLSVGLDLDDIESWPERIGAVTVAQVNAAARDVLGAPGEVTTRLLGPAAENGAAGQSDRSDQADREQKKEPS